MRVTVKAQEDFIQELDSEHWAQGEFARATLGDRRLDRRAARMASDFGAHPGASIAEACASQSARKAAYDFIENPFVRPEAVLLGHYQATLERMRSEAVILVPSDTTTFNYSGLVQTSGLGPIGTHQHPHQRGLWSHETLALTAQGLPLGLVQIRFWHRPEKSTDRRHRNQKPFEEKESLRWRESWQACQALRAQLPRQTLLLNITDMEGDIYEVFAAVLSQEPPRAEVLIRSRHNRQLEDHQSCLWDYVHHQKVAATLQVRVPKDQDQPARLATLHVRFSAVTVQAPERKANQPSLLLWAVEAWEVRPPKGAKRIVWHLLSSLPVCTAQQAVQMVTYYARRWTIEVLHKILKSVCRAESHQMEAGSNLQRRLMLDYLVAWRIQVLTQVGRQNPDLPANLYFPESEWKALYSYIHKTPKVPEQPPGLGQMLQWIGKLGGFVRNKANPYPGPITLARGLSHLAYLSTMWTIHLAKQTTTL
jgi:hypothetical protein